MMRLSVSEQQAGEELDQRTAHNGRVMLTLVKVSLNPDDLGTEHVEAKVIMLEELLWTMAGREHRATSMKETMKNRRREPGNDRTGEAGNGGTLRRNQWNQRNHEELQ